MPQTPAAAADLSLDRARAMDTADPLAGFRDRFHIPQRPGGDGRGNDGPALYFTGNSLGCMPKDARRLLIEELDDWERLGVEGHLHGRRPWFSYHERFTPPLARLVGASEREVVAMTTLTANLHLMLVSFYRPEGRRTKVMIEDDAFPSDSYAFSSHIASRGLDAEANLIRLRPREGEHTLRTEDIIGAIREAGDTLALVVLGGVNYLTGQWFDMPAITNAAKEAGARVGWDLAHAMGNVPMRLHDWGVDFAVWCSYKYLNGGPGAVAGLFVHEAHAQSFDLPRYAGWWGNDPATRFRMEPTFRPKAGAEGWQLSNPPILSLTPLIASLACFDEAGMPALRAKSESLTGFLEGLLRAIPTERISVITPADPGQRGCQLSLRVKDASRDLYDSLKREGVICDYREPGVIRVAPVPLYNTFEDVWRFADILRRLIA